MVYLSGLFHIYIIFFHVILSTNVDKLIFNYSRIGDKFESEGQASSGKQDDEI